MERKKVDLIVCTNLEDRSGIFSLPFFSLSSLLSVGAIHLPLKVKRMFVDISDKRPSFKKIFVERNGLFT